AHGESGGVHVGSTTLLMMWKLPVGVGYADWPTATPNTTGAWPGRVSVSECEDSSITIRVVSAPIVVGSAWPVTGRARDTWNDLTAAIVRRCSKPVTPPFFSSSSVTSDRCSCLTSLPTAPAISALVPSFSLVLTRIRACLTVTLPAASVACTRSTCAPWASGADGLVPSLNGRPSSVVLVVTAEVSFTVPAIIGRVWCGLDDARSVTAGGVASTLISPRCTLVLPAGSIAVMLTG